MFSAGIAKVQVWDYMGITECLAKSWSCCGLGFANAVMKRE